MSRSGVCTFTTHQQRSSVFRDPTISNLSGFGLDAVCCVSLETWGCWALWWGVLEREERGKRGGREGEAGAFYQVEFSVVTHCGCGGSVSVSAWDSCRAWVRANPWCLDEWVAESEGEGGGEGFPNFFYFFGRLEGGRRPAPHLHKQTRLWCVVVFVYL